MMNHLPPGLRKAARQRLRPAHRWVSSHLPLRQRRQYLYLAGTHRVPHFDNPKSHSEKVNWRILNDRRQIILDMCDKLKQKEIARSLVDESRLRIPKTLWTGTNLDEVPPELWEGEWVLKPTRSAGDVIFSPFTSLDDLKARTATWLLDHQVEELGEWGYAEGESVMMLEEKLPTQGVPVDYKVFVYDGKVPLLQVHNGRFSTGHRLGHYDADWNYLDVRLAHFEPGETPRPDNLDELIEVAKDLAKGWDCLRVDLYSINGEVWFGEFTVYPCGGVSRFQPSWFDDYLGSNWKLDKEKVLAESRADAAA